MITVNLPKRYMKGAIIAVDGGYLKITKDLASQDIAGWAHEAEPSTEKAYRSRKGTLLIESWQEKDAVGSVIEINGEFLHVEKVDWTRWGSIFGPGGIHTQAIGHYVAADKAAKLRAAHEAKMAPVLAERESLRRSQSDDAKDWSR